MIKTTPLLLRFEFLQSVFFMSWSLHAANLIAKKHTISRVCISFNFGFCFWHFKIVVIKLKVNNLKSGVIKENRDGYSDKMGVRWGVGGSLASYPMCRVHSFWSVSFTAVYGIDNISHVCWMRFSSPCWKMTCRLLPNSRFFSGDSLGWHHWGEQGC